MELYNATKGDGLMLVYSQPPRHTPTTRWLIAGAATAGFLIFTALTPQGWLIWGTLAALAGGGFIATTFIPHVTRVVTDFDNDRREVRVTTSHTQKSEAAMTISFDNVMTLALEINRIRTDGTSAASTVTLKLVTRDGRSLFLGKERAMFRDVIEGLLIRIRDSTGLAVPESRQFAKKVLAARLGQS